MLFYGLLMAESGLLYVVSLVALTIVIGWTFLSTCFYAGKERFKIAGFFFVLTLAALYLFGIFNIIEFMTNHPYEILLGIVIYLLGSYPYTRFVEWKFSKLPKLYDEREERENQFIHFTKRDFYQNERLKWFDCKREEFYAEKAKTDATFNQDSKDYDERLARRRFNTYAEENKLEEDWGKHIRPTLDVNKYVEEGLKEHGYKDAIHASSYKAWIVGHMVWWPM